MEWKWTDDRNLLEQGKKIFMTNYLIFNYLKNNFLKIKLVLINLLTLLSEKENRLMTGLVIRYTQLNLSSMV